MLLMLVEDDAGALDEVSRQALTLARGLAGASGLEAVVVGDVGAFLRAQLAAAGVDRVHAVTHERLGDYSPDGWAAAVSQILLARQADAVGAAGTVRGTEVLAHVAARLDLPLATGCVGIEPGPRWTVTRLRWGGVLHEDATLDAAVKLFTVAPHAVAATDPAQGGDATVTSFTPDLGEHDVRVRVRERVAAGGGVTLANAAVVVSGGRGVGSAEGFAVLEELAALLGGVVGCSRVATSNGWRPHADQVGQTGAVIGPDVYVACGISGATQHWVGCKNAKRILAINTDPDAPMVTRAHYAVIGDLHEVLPAVVAELRRTRAAASAISA
jgi:electron transfer flavoprotein alpha subunit